MELHVDPSYRRAAPAGGASAAAAAGRSRRLRRRALGTSGAAAVAAGVAIAVVTSGGGGTQSLVQVPAGTPTPARTAASPAPVVTVQPIPLATAALPSLPAVPPPDVRSSPTPQATHGPAPAGPKRPWHKPVVRETAGYNVGSLCQGSATADDPTDHGWCLSSVEVGEASTGQPATVGLELCRQTNGVTEGSLEFPDGQELEVVVGDGARQVWRWSVGVRVPPRPHTLKVGVGVCLRWRTTWNATTSDGRPVATGDYTVTSRLTAPGNGGLVTATTVTVTR